MQEYKSYINYLNSLVEKALVNIPENYSSIDSALDGEASRELRKLIDIDALRASGAFFTGSSLTKVALQNFAKTISNDSIILDPACGAGDLLIGCLQYIGTRSNLEETINAWSKQLIGYDIHNEFVEATRLRLALAAMREHSSEHKKDIHYLNNIFTNIIKKDGLGKDISEAKNATHIVMNPPFIIDDRYKSNIKGMVNSAASFMYHYINDAKDGTRILAILPDVLRSGEYYIKWREFIESRTIEENIHLYGVFDSSTDVDVFILELLVKKPISTKPIRWGMPNYVNSSEKVGDYFHIHVGSVVDNRDPHEGSLNPFIKPDNITPWEVVENISQMRKFKGRLFKPPFVVIRRTSRREHQFRAVGTIIADQREVAVENHLMVLIPRDNKLETCHKLIGNLKQQKTNDWLDQRIRCRHLTVSSLIDLPWWNEDAQ